MGLEVARRASLERVGLLTQLRAYECPLVAARRTDTGPENHAGSGLGGWGAVWVSRGMF